MALGAVLALLCGQDASWDLRNYHAYSGWAVFHDRSGDVAPAQFQGFFHPGMDALAWTLLEGLGPIGATASLGAIHGLLGLVATRFLRALAPSVHGSLGGAASVLALTSSTCAWQIGGTGGDIVVATCVIAAWTASIGGRFAAAGAFMGLAFGLKMTAFPFVIGTGVAALLGGRRSAIRFGLGFAALATCVLGPHLLSSWLRYDNPIFPMRNDWFRSPWAPIDPFFDTGYRLPLRALPGHLLSAALGTANGGWSGPWRDLRPLAAVAGALMLLPRPAARPVAIALLISLWAWGAGAGIARYALALDAAAPALLIAAFPVGRRGPLFACVVLLGLAATTVVPERERAPFPRAAELDAFGFVLPTLPDAGLAVVTGGDEPLGYAATAFPPGARHLRIESNLLGPTEETAFHAVIRGALRDASTILLLQGDTRPDRSLRAFGLSVSGPCVPLRPRVGPPLSLCPLQLD
jgi:hypothetical protein